MRRLVYSISCCWIFVLLLSLLLLTSGVSAQLPSNTPSISSSERPSWNPSSFPSQYPSSIPSNQPSLLPSLNPSSKPSLNPTLKPSSDPSTQPTQSPTRIPSLTPTEEPSSRPSKQPSKSPTMTGSRAPSKLVSRAPTMVESQVPSSQPSLIPTKALPAYGPIVQTGISMTLSGDDFDILTTTMIDQWQNETSFYIEKYFLGLKNKEIRNINVTLKVTAQKKLIIGDDSRRRRLSTKDVSLTYTQTTSYKSDVEESILYFIEEPFFNLRRRQDYILKHLSFLPQKVSTITIPSVIVPTSAPTPASSSSSMSSALIAGIAVGVGISVLCLVLFLFWQSKRKKETFSNIRWNNKSANHLQDPPSQLQLQGGDEVSTLAEPAHQRLGVRSNDSINEYGEESTVDYDYSGAYAGGGGGGESVVSSVGGTLGDSTTRGGKSTLVSAPTEESNSQRSSLFGEDDGLMFVSNPPKTKEIRMEVFAPKGKLGVVIDTPDIGPPTVHAIKETSCIADKIRVGDKLLAVDDENVRDMTAIKVSKLISRKSTNATRKLTILRTVIVESS